jgi:hypothetical protein
VRQPLDGSDAIGPLHLIKPPLVLRQMRAVALRMPEMDHSGREISVLPPHACAEQPDQQIGILQSPAAIGRIEAIHSIEIAPPDSEVAGASAAPGGGSHFAARPYRERPQRRQAIDASLASQHKPGTQAPEPGLNRLGQDAPREFGRQQYAIAGNEPSRFGQTAIKSGRGMQSPSRKMQ